LKKSRNVLGEDKPMPDTDVYRVVKTTERFTLMTEHIDQTGDVPGAQRSVVASLAWPALRCAQAANARELRRKAKLRYG
jgi:hypothetical protein